MLIYNITKSFPRDELFGLISQMRRSAVSVPANIVEGYSRASSRDKLNFYRTARASLSELEYYIDLSRELKYIDEVAYTELINARAEVGKLLYGFMKSIE